MKHKCNDVEDQTQKFKSCVLAATIGIAAPSNSFENQDTKSDDG